MIEIRIPNLLEVQLRLGRMHKKAPPVLARAINRATQNAKTNMVRMAIKRYVIKGADIKGTINLTKANKNSLNSTVKSIGKKIPLYKFKMNNYSPNQKLPKKRRKPYKVKILKTGGLKKIVNGFVAKVGNHTGVFKRVGGSNFPIKELFGPSIPQMIRNRENWHFIESEVKSTLRKRLDHEINRMLRR